MHEIRFVRRGVLAVAMALCATPVLGASERYRRKGAGPSPGNLVRAVQQALANRDFDPGPADGVLGPQTTRAITDFQASQGMATTGDIDEPLLSALGLR
ncbi:MAG: peptidoglycan-binding domain-containing protein [Pseudomonadota bacterium]